MSFFKGKRVLITGGSSGIGRALARILDSQEAELLLLARDLEKLKSVQQELGGRPKIVSLDIGDHEALKREFEGKDTKVDILINNAGITRPGNFLELPEECFEDMLRVNYLGAVNLTRLLVPQMIEKGEGRVAFVSSLLGQLGIWGYSAYAASKFAIRGFAECLRYELKVHNIAVTVCYPPDTDTPQHEWEQEYLPKETIAQASNGGLLSAERVATDLLIGIEKGRFEVIPGREAKFAATLNRFAPRILQAALDRDARRARNQ